jgi:hypothetical protein
MTTIYIVGTLGQAGSTINFAGGSRFEPINNGEFTSKRAAKGAAAECARDWAISADGEAVEVAVAVQRDESMLDLLATCTARAGNRRVQWS